MAAGGGIPRRGLSVDSKVGLSGVLVRRPPEDQCSIRYDFRDRVVLGALVLFVCGRDLRRCRRFRVNPNLFLGLTLH
jgi:hypothetical protein